MDEYRRKFLNKSKVRFDCERNFCPFGDDVLCVSPARLPDTEILAATHVCLTSLEDCYYMRNEVN